MIFNNDNNRGFLASIPPVTRNLLLINVGIWLVTVLTAQASGSLGQFGNSLPGILGLHFFEAPKFNPIQLVTYMFMHDPSNPMHIIFNMFTLWMFGRMMERVWGSKRFFVFYMVCGIGAAIVQEAVWAICWQHELTSLLAKLNGMTYDHMAQIINQGIATSDPECVQAVTRFKSQMLTVGASGAIFGILLGFAFVFPNLPLYLFFIPVPIKAKWMVLGYAVIEFYLGIAGADTTVAHFAHLGGMLFGLILLLYWKKKGTLHGNRFY